MQPAKQNFLTILGIVIALACTMATSLSYAGPREQARRIHDRLAGVPPSDAVIDSMAAKISAGDGIGAAFEAMENPAFYNTTVREFASPWTNRERSVYVDMNDSVATVIGMIRDDVPFDQVLYEDIVYVGSANATNTAYSQTNNDHYLDLQTNRVDLSDAANLTRQLQSNLPGSPIGIDQTAGIMTTRGFSEAYYVAGTNRAALRFATLNFMCMDMEDFSDITAHPDRIRQDVTRSPGGDSTIFLNDCLSCHAGLDGLAGAFAYYDFNEETGRLEYTAGTVQPKFLFDAGTFRYGYETVDDSWVNYWRTGPNAFVGWNGQGSGEGTGVKNLGMELSQTRQFAKCQVKQVFEKVCYRTPNGPADMQAVENIATSFEANNRSMKQVFAETALHCMGN
ncbi:MAG: hypothetical protein KJN95_13705 [Gammaproteobacteria bacterium]|nr:hypothetical protein [Gammaproteobacteria bacterium]